jgi:hypothetical protein
MATHTILADRPSRVETMTGLTSDQVDRLVLDVYAHGGVDPARRRAVGPCRAVLVVLLYLRQNLSQALLAELFGCSQPTVSRLIGRIAPGRRRGANPGRRAGRCPGPALHRACRRVSRPDR